MARTCERKYATAEVCGRPIPCPLHGEEFATPRGCEHVERALAAIGAAGLVLRPVVVAFLGDRSSCGECPTEVWCPTCRRGWSP